MNAATLDARETRDPAEREAALLAALPGLVAHAKAHSPAQAARLAQVDAARIDSRAALARLPVLRKHELLAQQQAARAAGGDPFGGFAASGWSSLHLARRAKRVFQSPGPLYEPQGLEDDSWRMSRAMYAAGFREGELVHNSFSYHLTPAGAMMEEGALALGCTVFPGGVGNTEMQLQAMADLRPQGYCGTPSFLKIALEKAAGRPLSLSKALVSGEACPPSLRDWFGAQGIAAYQCYATADVGLIAYETPAREGLVLDEQVIVEIVGPDGQPVAEGEVGEVVVTSFDADYPLIRFGTGDLSAVLPGRCPTGRTNTRIKGWMGRADQTTKVRGMFVHPSQVQAILQRFPELGRVRLVVSGEMASDAMVLQAECAAPGDALQARVAEAVREVTKLRGEVLWCAVGSLPQDGRLIDDQRSYR
ncbi:MAG TPA: AMP-binding protein [Pseudorhodoferax sp.]|jgi:phenylacetate-CoA ligase|nr:AMP-binding protein [Pseudorhodoferax sp.]